MDGRAGTHGADGALLPKLRLYVDEVGNHDLQPEYPHANDRFLSLTGVIIDLDLVRTTLSPALDDLKSRYFGSHPDHPVVLHRREMVRHQAPFHSLRDEATKNAFGAELIALVERLDFTLITVVIDKLEHQQRYGKWTATPTNATSPVALLPRPHIARARAPTDSSRISGPVRLRSPWPTRWHRSGRWLPPRCPSPTYRP